MLSDLLEDPWITACKKRNISHTFYQNNISNSYFLNVLEYVICNSLLSVSGSGIVLSSWFFFLSAFTKRTVMEQVTSY